MIDADAVFEIEGVSRPRIKALKPLLNRWPVWIARKRIEKYTGGLVTANTLRDYDRKGKGPRVRFRTRFGIAYPTPYLLEWLEDNGFTWDMMEVIKNG